MTNYFSKNLKFLREKKRIDQQDIADKLDVPRSTYSCWENGLRTPKIEQIQEIANYFDVDIDIISRDYSIEEKSKPLDELDILFSKHKDILTDEDKEYMRFIIEKRKKEIDKQLGED